MSLFEVSYVALWLLVVVLAVGLYALYYHFGEMYLTSPEGRANQGPEIGEPLRAARGTPLEGPTLELPLASQRTVLLFTAQDCAVCRELFNELADANDDEILQDIVVVASGSTSEAEKWASIVPRGRVIVDPRAGLRSRYGIGLTPFGVAADASGLVRTRGVVSNASNLRGLVVQARIDEQQTLVAAGAHSTDPNLVAVRG